MKFRVTPKHAVGLLACFEIYHECRITSLKPARAPYPRNQAKQLAYVETGAPGATSIWQVWAHQQSRTRQSHLWAPGYLHRRFKNFVKQLY